MARGTAAAKKAKQPNKKMDEMAIATEREYGRKSTTPRTAARRASATSSASATPAKRPATPGRKPAAAAKRPAARKGAASKKRSGK